MCRGENFALKRNSALSLAEVCYARDAKFESEAESAAVIAASALSDGARAALFR
jgi:hypothetical protein